MTTRRTWTARLLAAGAALGLLTGLAPAQVKIGFHAPLTGPAAADGKSALQGAQIAVKQANAAGGIGGSPVELVSYDDQTKADQAVALANKMVGDKLVAVVSGSYSGPTRSAATVFHQAGIPYVSAYAVHPDITTSGNFAFRTAFVGEVQGRGGAKLTGEALGKKRVVMLTVNNDFGQSVAAGFKEAAPKFGITIVKEYNFGMGDRQFGPLVASVRADNPEAIYLVGYFFNGGPLVKQLRDAGIAVQIVGTEGIDGQTFIDIVGAAAAEGVVITTALDRDSTDPETRGFIDDYEKSFGGSKADMVAASAHAAMKVVIENMRKAGTADPKALRDAIAANTVPTVLGPLAFNRLGEVRKPLQIQVVKGGAWHRHSVIDDPVLLAPPDR
ncbi:MAG: ABC transporter substrate-binding protein [Alphaproteobacteria bacterium]|nr:ABC transporter substrate-binding protein [Alphaproteobacteria bacterium]